MINVSERSDTMAFNIREATINDSKLILDFIKALAKYEKMSDAVTATEDSIKMSLFKDKYAEVIIGEESSIPVAFALYYYNYSTFLGKANLFLEDLFVYEPYRNKGYGKAMLKHLASIAVKRNCSRLDWYCLNWNHPSIEFYKKLGAKPLNDWMIFRLEKDALKALSE
ncbi:N-acetyltransferase family protein [Liberiplasma polymorphum]|uniref:GNAT family N-acetyltransferase n=1 Tax=Liberiplasma polymorphum TaxID=3374570 RepID=UPI00377463F7